MKKREKNEWQSIYLFKKGKSVALKDTHMPYRAIEAVEVVVMEVVDVTVVVVINCSNM